jgi:hypothetical protein
VESSARTAVDDSGPAETSELDFVTPSLGWAVSIDSREEPLLQAGQTPFPGVPDQLWQTSDGGSTWVDVTPHFTTSSGA